MIDKLLQTYTMSPNVSGMVQEETSKAGQVGKGLEGQKEKYGLRMKKGGMACKGQGLARKKKFKVY
jgi:hypothetical protein